MSITRYLSSLSKEELIADLTSYGFVFSGPHRNEVVHHAGNDCVWLEHVPVFTGAYDAEGNAVFEMSADFCANTTLCEGHVFAKEIAKPGKPYNTFDL